MVQNAADMDPGRKRRLRLILALTAVVLLASALVYTSFSASSETRTPSDLLASAEEGESYELTGRVEPGYVRRGGNLHFRVRDRKGGGESVPVRYSGTIPDPFRADREVIVEVRKEGDAFVGQRDSLVTKCPSKFTSEQES
jgi:cytochrome c-type biogenesis protein CcmE